jgi:hypothetical protein
MIWKANEHNYDYLRSWSPSLSSRCVTILKVILVRKSCKCNYNENLDWCLFFLLLLWDKHDDLVSLDTHKISKDLFLIPFFVILVGNDECSWIRFFLLTVTLYFSFLGLCPFRSFLHGIKQYVVNTLISESGQAMKKDESSHPRCVSLDNSVCILSLCSFLLSSSLWCQSRDGRRRLKTSSLDPSNDGILLLPLYVWRTSQRQERPTPFFAKTNHSREWDTSVKVILWCWYHAIWSSM